MKKSYPKEGDKKLKETIKDLRSELRSLKKELRVLKAELQNIIKPKRKRRSHREEPKRTSEEWRSNFVAEIKANIEKRLKNGK